MTLIPTGKQWPDNLPSGGSSATPSEFNYTTAPLTINSNLVLDLPIPVPSNRMYGISVYVTGLTGVQTCFVQIFGDTARTEVQYSANFTTASSSDTAQAWRYRSRAEDKTLHLRVTNTGSSALGNVQISFKAEPF
jgi:hypothetical protein